MQGDARAVLDFWFGNEPAARREWFRKDPAFDAQIRDRFGVIVEAMLGGASFGDSADERLARILVLD